MALVMKKTFKGGVHPSYNKELTSSKKIISCPLPDEVILPVSQHIGAPAEVIVEKGDEVKAGQVVAEAKAKVSSRVIATVSGKVTAVEKRLHPTGTKVLSVIIKTDKEKSGIEKMPVLDDPSKDQIIQRVRDAGIVGLGGAAFPVDIKLQVPKDYKIETVIANGCECEPYLTSDDRQMIEESEELIDGLKLVMKVVGAKKGVIAVEDNKTEAIEILKSKVASEPDLSVLTLATKYPQGAADMLIKTVIGKEVPVGGRSTSTGGYIQNIGTLINISKSVRKGLPLISRVVTVTGDIVKNPQNYRVPIGTPISHLIGCAGGLTADSGRIIIGGPMTGLPQFSFEVPVIKATGGIVALKDKNGKGNTQLYPCIRCSQCISACPMGLVPSALSIYSEVGLWERAEEYDIDACIECSSCSFVCPAKRPIAQMIKFAKQKIKEANDNG